MSQKKIFLIIEDDIDDQLFIQDGFKNIKDNFELTLIGDGEEAISYMKDCSSCPDLIILDLNLPKKNGKEILNTIRSKNICKFVPIIIFTTCSDRKDLVECYENGANGFVIKPNDWQEYGEVFENIYRYWFQTVKIPRSDNHGNEKEILS